MIFFLCDHDFNIDLLQYESHNSTNDFLNSMVSHPFLPYISFSLQELQIILQLLLITFFLT